MKIASISTCYRRDGGRRGKHPAGMRAFEGYRLRGINGHNYPVTCRANGGQAEGKRMESGREYPLVGPSDSSTLINVARVTHILSPVGTQAQVPREKNTRRLLSPVDGAGVSFKCSRRASTNAT